ncbi:uncharacterized protein CC84DRAFT_1260733 [Paraphaeosphaeria sporulosa]|uniref:Uncharacterized protein n=1 Tax=Paraphaeosphaeria sporulosa TaxID=1460663 RepID=A0A177C7I1_9PLEO|nr:uncharacterized protein CC84DRAFT_1260733 [Paraphaeosphaeria sporulosa]OAG03603.1 hypothetical protein CC84DRAFT_1260733 [Paraphaeosphaeria sporulosa]
MAPPDMPFINKRTAPSRSQDPSPLGASRSRTVMEKGEGSRGLTKRPATHTSPLRRRNSKKRQVHAMNKALRPEQQRTTILGTIPPRGNVPTVIARIPAPAGNLDQLRPPSPEIQIHGQQQTPPGSENTTEDPSGNARDPAMRKRPTWQRAGSTRNTSRYFSPKENTKGTAKKSTTDAATSRERKTGSVRQTQEDRLLLIYFLPRRECTVPGDKRSAKRKETF